MEVGVKYLPNYWAFGYGGRTLDSWGPDIDGRGIVDMVNNYLIAATSGGLLAMILYIAIKIGVLVSLVRCYQRGEPAIKTVAFGLASLLIGLSFSELSVGLFGPPLLLSYISMGFAVSCSEWVEQREFSAQRRRAAQTERGHEPGHSRGAVA
jgi:hypothetical protein